MFFFFLINMIM